jgi:transcriptional regulator with XRE-family HTH domain
MRGATVNLIREKIGIMIREKRNSQHLTQEELAEKVNLSTGMIGQIERGETMPSVENLDVIIQELGIDPRSLFGGTPPSSIELAELYMIISRMNPNQQHLLLKIARVIRDD